MIFEVHDGIYEHDPQIAKYCGIKDPFEVVSSGSELFVRFKTDLSVQQEGFTAEYTLAQRKLFWPLIKSKSMQFV